MPFCSYYMYSHSQESHVHCCNLWQYITCCPHLINHISVHVTKYSLLFLISFLINLSVKTLTSSPVSYFELILLLSYIQFYYIYILLIPFTCTPQYCTVLTYCCYLLCNSFITDDGQIELGAHWIHGEEDNVVYQWASENGLVSDEISMVQTGRNRGFFINQFKVHRFITWHNWMYFMSNYFPKKGIYLCFRTGENCVCERWWWSCCWGYYWWIFKNLCKTWRVFNKWLRRLFRLCRTIFHREVSM